MNTLKIFTLLFIGSFAVNAQDLQKNQVPNEVMSAFEKTYSNVNDVEWEKQGEGFGVEFEQNRMDNEVWYAASGKVLKTEKELKVSEVPAAIKKTVKTDYSGFKIEDAEVQTENNTTTYFVELEDGEKEKTVSFDKTGKVLEEWND